MATDSDKINLLSLLQRPESVEAQKALDFLDGKFEPWLIKFLNDPQKGRKSWNDRGIVPRFRNITKMVVEKSGLLFSQNTPRLSVYDAADPTTPDTESTEKLYKLFEDFDWVEFFSNFDMVVRLMKTALVLVQWDPAEAKIVPSILTQANSYAHCDQLTGKLQALVVKLAGSTNEPKFNSETGTVVAPNGCVYFRVFTPEKITDYVVDNNGDQTPVGVVDNPWGIIPVAVFHDVLTPRADCFWNQGPHDLLCVQEMYNIHLTDAEYAIQYSKLQTLVTNAKIVQDQQDVPVLSQLYGQSLPRFTAGQRGIIVGPGSVLTLETNGETPFVQYMGPDPDIAKLDDVFNGWIADYAADWSVNVKSGNGKTGTSGNAAKTSGFQLVVEEIDNIQLRQRRQKMMAAGFNRLFDVIQVVVNVVQPGTFNEAVDLDLCIEFSHPRLPLDQKDEAETWVMRVQNNQASLVDYFMEVKGLSRDEAVLKVKEVQAINAGDLDYVMIESDGTTVTPEEAALAQEQQESFVPTVTQHISTSAELDSQ
jgi:hypothetical protein